MTKLKWIITVLTAPVWVPLVALVLLAMSVAIPMLAQMILIYSIMSAWVIVYFVVKLFS